MFPPGVSSNASQKELVPRAAGFLQRHPILAIALLTPGIPEYLSGSSSTTLLALDPARFLILLALNMGLYTTGVLLIREAMVCWKKGWGSVFLLGFAYAIVEEGLALRTLYDPNSPVVGSLGVYGHYLGVNWVWTGGLLLFHSAFSISLPILLFRLALPDWKGRNVLHRRGIILCLAILAVDSIILTGIARYDPGSTILLSSGLAVIVFILVARKLPQGLLAAKEIQPSRRPRTVGLLGLLFFPSTLLTGAVLASANAPPLIPIILDFILAGIITVRVFRWIGREKNRVHKTALALGLIIPVACFGIGAAFAGNPLITLPDVLIIVFMRRMWKNNHLQMTPSPQIPLLEPAIYQQADLAIRQEYAPVLLVRLLSRVPAESWSGRI